MGCFAAAVYCIDVVLGIEGMSVPRIAGHVAFAFEAEAVEQHDRHIDAAFARGDHPVSQSLEVDRIEKGQVKLGFSVQGRCRPRALVGHRIVADRALFCPAIQASLPGPKAEAIVVVPLQEGQVRGEVHGLRGGQRFIGIVLKVAPGVGTGQQDRLAAPVGEVAGIGRVYAEGTIGRRRDGRTQAQEGENDAVRGCHVIPPK